LRRRSLALAAALLAPAPLAGEGPPPRGVETADIDRSVSPCADLDAFANGAWRAANPIPPSMARWSRPHAAAEAAKDERAGLLAQRTGSPLVDHYAACTDEPRVEALGREPVQPLLAEIDGLADIAGVQRILGRLHDRGIPVPFGIEAGRSPRDPSRVVAHVVPGELGLPGREHYLSPEPPFREVREKYRVHVAHLIELGGATRAASRQAAEAVFAMERQLAAALPDAAARRSAGAAARETSFVDLTILAPNVDWPGAFDAAKLPRAAVVVENPAFLKAVDELFLMRPLASWKAYLKFHLLRAAAPFLSSAFVTESFSFEGRALGGVQEMKPRGTRCVEAVDADLAGTMGRAMGRRVSPEAQAAVQAIAKQVVVAAEEEIRGLPGLAPRARAAALARLARLSVTVGAPAGEKEDPAVPIGRETLWANVVALRERRVADERARIGRPAAPDEIVLSADLLRPPALRLDATEAVSYGAIGSLIGDRVAGLFDGLPLDGTRLALRAFLMPRPGRPEAPTLDGFTPEQQFFVAWAQLRGEAVRPEAERLGTPAQDLAARLAGLPEFRKAFACPAQP
jgi:endothelin-converting enzyme/putative endopeptidase